ncbi:MAG: Cof-type HAD-IIB family hydrolase [Muricoprocola sp.]
MSIKLLAIDMDGTCLNSKNKISDENLFWLRKARAQGMEIIPTTGRTLTCIPYQLKEEPLFRYVITSNGAMVTDTNTGEDVFRALIPKGTAMELMRKCQGKGLGMTAHINHEYLIQGKVLAALGRLQYGKDASYSKPLRNIMPYIEKANDDVEELQFFFFSQSARKRTELALQQYPDLAAAYSENYVEIYSRQATKGTALAAAAEHLSIGQDKIACIGNGENDLSMFHEAGLRFAVENAVPELKAAADRVVSSNNESGVAEAIQYIFKNTDVAME